jgi:hypothetical protein
MDQQALIDQYMREGRTVSGGHDHPAWYKLLVSPASDPGAITSAALLAWLNLYPVPGALAAKCSDGTFAFVGNYPN